MSIIKLSGILLGSFLFSSTLLYSLDLNLPVSAELNASNGLCLLADEPSTAMINPSVMHPGICTASTSLFSFSSLLLHHISAVRTMGTWGIATGGSYLDHISYREIMAILALSKQIENFRIGLDLRYLHNRIKGYYQSGRLLFDLALTWRSRFSSTTLLYKNVMQQKILSNRLPSFLIWETCLQITDQFKLALGLEKQHKEEFIFKLGTVGRINSYLDLLASCQQQPARLGVGLTLQVSHLQFSYSIRSHRHLPYTHSISLSYEIPGN